MPKPADGLRPGCELIGTDGVLPALLRGDAFPAHPLDFSVKSEPSELMFAQDGLMLHLERQRSST